MPGKVREVKRIPTPKYDVLYGSQHFLKDDDLVFLSQDSLDCQTSGELGTLTPAAPARSLLENLTLSVGFKLNEKCKKPPMKYTRKSKACFHFSAPSSLLSAFSLFQVILALKGPQEPRQCLSTLVFSCLGKHTVHSTNPAHTNPCLHQSHAKAGHS